MLDKLIFWGMFVICICLMLREYHRNIERQYYSHFANITFVLLGAATWFIPRSGIGGTFAVLMVGIFWAGIGLVIASFPTRDPEFRWGYVLSMQGFYILMNSVAQFMVHGFTKTWPGF